MGEAFKLITESPSKETYLVKLSEIVALTHKIRVSVQRSHENPQYEWSCVYFRD